WCESMSRVVWQNSHTKHTQEETMSRFKTTPIDENNTGSWVERRRKGRMIRKQHTVTGAWTDWERDPNVVMVEAKRALIERVAEKNRTRRAHNTAENVYSKMTVTEL